LGAAVVGQPRAVAAAASQLDSIKSGLPEPGKPASVMLFAGLTGVGKTELAKTLARFYSSSKRLQTYTMANFTQPHSVSGIVGVPPGYVGHEQGGRLINELNSDPYGVFLLDEAEKAHPDIWKLFLNLFDEAWIVDQRAVKAFADRAIFILTTNIGADIIAQRSRAGVPMEQVVVEVREELSKVRHHESNQLVFPPEFLARIHQIVVFNPLEEDALRAICTMAVDRMADEWLAKRDKRLVVPETLVTHIARQGHAADVRSGFKEGGRIIRKLIGELVRDRVLAEARARKAEYEDANLIELRFLPAGPASPSDLTPSAKVVVHFATEPAPTVGECLTDAAAELRRLALGMAPAPPAGTLRATPGLTPTTLPLFAEAGACLDRLGARAKPAGDTTSDHVLTAATDVFRGAIDQLTAVQQRRDDEARGIVDSLATRLDSLASAAAPEGAAEPAHA
jgi:energy-coupling factor transporter ATP-binding protein EcfA2